MIDIQNHQEAPFPEAYRREMQIAGQAALDFFGVRGKLAVAIVSDESIHRLNRDYRGMDRPTDVLSFAAREGTALASAGKGEFLGDVAISLPTALRQASEYGHSAARELCFLTVHGALHLLGYDHMTPEDEAEMTALQKEILTSVHMER